MGSAFLKWCNYCVLQPTGVSWRCSPGGDGSPRWHRWPAALHGQTSELTEAAGISRRDVTAHNFFPNLDQEVSLFFFFLSLPSAGIWTPGIFPRKRGKPRRFNVLLTRFGRARPVVLDRAQLNIMKGETWCGRGGKEKPRLRVDRPVLVRFCFACWKNFAGTRLGFTMRAWTPRPVPVLGEDINKTNSSVAAGCCSVMHWKIVKTFCATEIRLKRHWASLVPPFLAKKRTAEQCGSQPVSRAPNCGQTCRWLSPKCHRDSVYSVPLRVYPVPKPRKVPACVSLTLVLANVSVRTKSSCLRQLDLDKVVISLTWLVVFSPPLLTSSLTVTSFHSDCDKSD